MNTAEIAIVVIGTLAVLFMVADYRSRSLRNAADAARIARITGDAERAKVANANKAAFDAKGATR